MGDDVTDETLHQLRQMLEYVEIAQEKGDTAYIETSNFEKKVVIKVNRRKKTKEKNDDTI